MTEPEKLKLRQLLGHLTAAQVWALLGAVAALLAGIFSIGFSAATYRSNIEVSRVQVERQRRIDDEQRKLTETNPPLRKG
jgi:hypothetical protein